MNHTDVSSALSVDGLVLAQATSSVDDALLVNIGSETGGLVLTDRAGIHKTRSLRTAGFDRPIVLDLLGTNWRSDEDASLARRTTWHEATSACTADVVVSPSRTVAPGDELNFEAQVAESLDLLADASNSSDQERLLGLALHGAWLDSEHVGLLVDLISQIPEPVAVAFASPFDPIGTQARVDGLLRLVDHSGLPVLRSDLAGVGAWANGARFTSIGLSSTVRHLPVPMRRGERQAHHDSPHVLVPTLLAWVRGSRLYFVGDHAGFRCVCSVCQGRPLARLGDGAPGRKEEALLHSFEVWSRLTRHLMGAPDDERRWAWQRLCKAAVDAEEELASELGIALPIKWQPVRAWLWR